MNSDPPAPGVDRENPWPGLAAFTEDIREFFHGRTAPLLRQVKYAALMLGFALPADSRAGPYQNAVTRVWRV